MFLCVFTRWSTSCVRDSVWPIWEPGRPAWPCRTFASSRVDSWQNIRNTRHNRAVWLHWWLAPVWPLIPTWIEIVDHFSSRPCCPRGWWVSSDNSSSPPVPTCDSRSRERSDWRCRTRWETHRFQDRTMAASYHNPLDPACVYEIARDGGTIKLWIHWKQQRRMDQS